MLGIIQLMPLSLIAQKSYYFRLKTTPSISWRGDESSKANLVNSFGIMVGYSFNKRISLETGLGFNRVGFKYVRVAESIGVINGFNTYTLEGEIPVKQKFTERFIEFPIQLNYIFKQKNGIDLFFNSRVSLNFFNQVVRKTWYYHKTDQEFTTKNTFSGTQGRDKLAFSYELGMNIQKKITEKIALGTGIQYKQLYHNHKFPFKPKKRHFNSIGVDFYLIYRL